MQDETGEPVTPAEEKATMTTLINLIRCNAGFLALQAITASLHPGLGAHSLDVDWRVVEVTVTRKAVAL
jgi:hypothetical protein